MQKLLCVLGLALLFSSVSLAQTFDPMTAMRVSVVSMQNVLGAVPLPSLGTLDTSHISVQAGYQTAQVSGPVAAGAGFDGSFTGGGLGLGLSGRVTPNVGFYLMTAGNLFNGSINAFDPTDGSFAFVVDSATDGGMLTTGLDDRLIGDDHSFFALGLFGGPTSLYFQTSFKTAPLQGNPTHNYSASVLFYGALGGLQSEFRLGNFVVAPYGMYFLDLSQQCKVFQTDSPTSGNPSCGGTNAVQVPGSFAAFGLGLGYKALRIDVYSLVLNDPSMQGISIQNYRLSYTF